MPGKNVCKNLKGKAKSDCMNYRGKYAGMKPKGSMKKGGMGSMKKMGY